MTSRKRFLALALVICMMASVFSACSSGDSKSNSADAGSTSNSQSESSKNSTTDEENSSATDTGSGGEAALTVLWFSDGGEGDTFQRLADRYIEEHSGVTVEMITVPYDELDNRIKNMLAAGQAPSIIRQSNIGQYSNQLIELREYVDAGDAFPDNFVDGGLPTEFDGKMIGAPNDTTANGLIYNKTAFAEAGVEVPASEDDIWTWEEFEEALKQVMANGGVTYGLVVDRTPQRFSTLMYQAGGSMLNEDLNAPNFDSEGTRTAIEWFKSLHEQEIIPDSVWLSSDDPNNLFRSGQVACHLGGSWLITNYVEQITDFEWGVTYMPYEAHRSSIPGGKYLAAFDGTGVEKEAALFIEWLSKPEVNAEYCQENYFISPVVGNETLKYDQGAEYFEIFNNELAASTSAPGNEWMFQQFSTQISNDMRDSLAEVLAGSKTVDEYVEEMTGKSQTALDNLK